MRFISNVIWVLLGGFWLALLWGVVGIVFCLTIIGIPFGVQCFKAAKLSFSPYGKRVRLNFGKHPVCNTLWAILGGWETAILYFLIAVLNCITIIGIPRGLQCFKIMKLAFCPFGATVENK